MVWRLFAGWQWLTISSKHRFASFFSSLSAFILTHILIGPQQPCFTHFTSLFFFTSITFWLNDWLISDLCSMPLVILQKLTSFGCFCLNTCRWPAIAVLSEPACSSILHFCSKTQQANVFFCIFFVVVCLFRDARKLAGGAVTPIFFVSCVTFCLSLFSISVPGDLQLPDIKKNNSVKVSFLHTSQRQYKVFFYYPQTLEQFPWGKSFMLTSPWWPRS